MNFSVFFPNKLGVAYDENLMYKFYVESKNGKNKSSVGIIVYTFLILPFPCLVMVVYFLVYLYLIIQETILEFLNRAAQNLLVL